MFLLSNSLRLMMLKTNLPSKTIWLEELFRKFDEEIVSLRCGLFVLGCELDEEELESQLSGMAKWKLTFIWCIRSSRLRSESRLSHILLTNFPNLQLKALFVGENVAVCNLKRILFISEKIEIFYYWTYLETVGRLCRREHSVFLEQLHHQVSSLL